MVAMAKRTKEQLIAMQRWLREESSKRGYDAIDLATVRTVRGDMDGALRSLARQAGEFWLASTLASFDLKRIDEQGFLIEAGEVEWRPQQEGGAGREVVTWKAGDHLGEVLAMGDRLVTERVRQELETRRGKEEQAAPVILHESPPCAHHAGKATETVELNLPEGPWVVTVHGGKLPVSSIKALERAIKQHIQDGKPMRVIFEAPPGARIEVTPLVRKVPETREEFFAALGIESGRSYPGLRENIATWMGLPLTEEQSKAQAAAARAAETGMCHACRERQEICARCGGTTEKHPIGPMMFSLVGADGRTYTAPICRACLGKGDLDKMTVKDGRIVPKAVELIPLPITGTGDPAHDDYYRRLKREVADQYRLSSGSANQALVEAGYNPSAMTAAQIVEAHGRGLLPGLAPGMSLGLVDGEVTSCDETRRFTEREVDTMRARMRAPSPVPTFAELLQSGKPAVVAVLEPNPDRCARLFEQLFALGGAKVDDPRDGGDRFTFGPVTVWIAHYEEQTKYWPRGGWDVAIGFNASRAADLTDGVVVAAASAAWRFWGIA